MLGGLTAPQHDSLRRMIAVDVTIAMALSTCSVSWSSTARPVPPCSPIWAGMRSARSRTDRLVLRVFPFGSRAVRLMCHGPGSALS